jgi:ABC-type transport system involved in multi-copper enzyme maturation permease subunit
MRPTLGDSWLIARFELAESLRSRRALAVSTLFLLTALGLAFAYSEAVEGIRGAIGDRPLLRGAADTAYEQLLLSLAGGDRRMARFMASQSPAALFLVKMASWFVPILVALTSAEGIASDLGSRAARYTLLRTSRLSFALGKLLGQALLVGTVLGGSALVFFAVALVRTRDFDVAAAAASIALFSPFLIAHALCFVALAALASQLVASPAAARALALALLVAAGLLLGMPGVVQRAGLPSVFGWVSRLSPYAHHSLAFEPSALLRAAGVFAYLALATVYFWAGYLRLRARDV